MSITLSNLKSFQKPKKKKRVGRGDSSGHGTYSGRGIKGQRARTGSKRIKRGFFLLRALPKVGGFKSRQEKPAVLNLDRLNKLFKENEEVSPKILEKKKIIKKGQRVKILARGNLEKKLFIKGCTISQKTREKIEKN